MQEAAAGQGRRFAEVARSIEGSGQGIRDILTTHHKLVADVAVLLRTIHRMDNLHFPAIGAYLSRYKAFSEALGGLVREVLGGELSREGGQALVAGLEPLRQEVAFVYEELVGIAAVARDEGLVQEMFKAGKRPEGEEREEGGRRERGTGRQGAEERNRFALSVVRRVRVKLEGREPDALRRAAVPEQVGGVEGAMVVMVNMVSL